MTADEVNAAIDVLEQAGRSDLADALREETQGDQAEESIDWQVMALAPKIHIERVIEVAAVNCLRAITAERAGKIGPWIAVKVRSFGPRSST